MQKPKLVVMFVTIGALSAIAFAQERTRPRAPATLPELLSQAGTSCGEGRYSACLSELREATALVMAERVKVIRAALPPAPQGMEKIAPDDSNAAIGAFAAALTATVGTVVNQEYSGSDKSITVAVTVDSPLMQMFGLMSANPEMLEKGSELIKYGAHKGILKDNGMGDYQLQILIDKTMVQIESTGLSDDALLAFMDQKTVDALAVALAK
jgi:hypothetical protein